MPMQRPAQRPMRAVPQQATRGTNCRYALPLRVTSTRVHPLREPRSGRAPRRSASSPQGSAPTSSPRPPRCRQ
eukprot:2696675-Alexandrium_andersonii.AAC.1